MSQHSTGGCGCDGCLWPPCGECLHCEDTLNFGGVGLINKHCLKTICKDDKLSIDDIEFIIYNEDIHLNPRQVTKQEKMTKKREALEKEKQAKKEVLCKMKKAKKKELEKEKTEKRRKKLAVKKKLKADKGKLKQVILGGSKGIIVENNNSIETALF